MIHEMFKERVIRIEKILLRGDENWISCCREKLCEKLDRIESQIHFIEKRFNLIDTCKWIGSFKKPLLWQSRRERVNKLFLFENK